MLFSSIEFLYYFLPIVIALYFIVPFKMKNLILLIASLFFYFWGEPIYTILMAVMALSGYIHGLLIDKYRGTKKSKVALVSSIIVGLAALGFFKYSNFFIENVNLVFGSTISTLKIVLPIGISFYTFQILSYTIDLYRGKYPVQKNFIDFFTYVALFPQLIAGPIVRYSDVDKELKERKHSLENFAYGVNRFMIGLSKKILLANVLAEFCNIVKETENMSVVFMWAYIISYALHIYFDFSGYSDMAIGLGRIFGFHFPENFNYPYISKSITEFWRRWHMTLSSWFRDYVYIPLGGNRVSKLKWIRNIFVVWFLTGFWHGAGWTFVLWGLMFALLLFIEKIFFLGENAVFNRSKKKIENEESTVAEKSSGAKILGVIGKGVKGVFSHAYVILFVLISWVLFDANALPDGKTLPDSEALVVAGERLSVMFGISDVEFINEDTIYYLTSYAGVLLLAVVGCTPFVKTIVTTIKSKKTGKRIINVLEPVMQIGLFVLTTAYLIDGSFNPFLYFRF